MNGRARLLLVLATLLLSACVSVHRMRPDGSTERVPRAELRDYAQTVFKRRNAVATQFLEQDIAADADGSEAVAKLEEAETRMDDACAPVDALAIAYRDGDRIGLLAKLQLVRALEGCATATEAASRALEEDARGDADGASQVH